ncbi:hypothetical protein [Albidovulum sediminis]|uniref:Uncharacterized protein n=1 Tax=Albidovulum sediminis TaxID=3066345 RepID=A0ABT2NMV6_9RHOB|nr:hypothetical protein [Defluviimonas sediminis]MCT8328894.1 hypothetical protein [Defluviimonas sediminis]
MGVSRQARLALSGVLSCALALHMPWAPLRAAAQEMPHAALFDTYYQTLEEVQIRLRSASRDLGSVSDHLLFSDPEEVLDWVRQNIAFQQYAGLLRGPDGTLLAGAGNALDQAVLVAALLGDAGYQTQVVRGRLSEGDARALVLRMERTPAGAPLDAEIRASLSALEQSGDAIVDAVGGLVRAWEAPGPDYGDLAERTADAADALLARLDEADFYAGGSVLEELAEEAADYYWTEARLGPADDWTALHPVFDDRPPDPVERGEAFANAVPVHLQHRVRVDITLEQKLGKALRTHSLLSGWERPAANLNGEPLTITTLPFSLDPWDRRDDPLSHVTENRLFVTLFRNEVASGLAFDLDGNVAPLAEAMDAAGAMFQTLGSKASDAAAGIGALGSGAEVPADAAELTALWIDFTLIAPGGRETTIRRTVLDRIGAKARAEGSVEAAGGPESFLPMIGQRSAMVSIGDMPEAFFLGRYLSAQAGQRPVVEQLALQSVDFQPDRDLAATEGFPPEDYRAAEVFQYLDLAPSGGGTIRYRAQPALVIVGDRFGFAPGGEAIVETFVDVVANPARTLLRKDGDLTGAARDAVTAGVWDTALEGYAIGRGPRPALRGNALDHLEAALREGHALVVLKPGETDEGSLDAYGPEAAAGMARELAAGFWIVAKAPEEDGGNDGWWWRIAPRSGETLGILSDGSGGEIIKYLIVLSIGAAVAGTIKSAINRRDCIERISRQSGADLQLRDPDEYELQVSNCGIGSMFWPANRAIHEALRRHEQVCEDNFAVAAFSGACSE